MVTTIEVTCGCGKVLKAPAAFAGKKGRCKACGAKLLIPDPTPLAATQLGNVWSPPAPVAAGNGSDDVALAEIAAAVRPEDDDLLSPLPPRVDAKAAGPTTAPTPAPAVIPPEPFYYGFLAGFATLTLVLGLIGFGIAFIVALVSVTADNGGSVPAFAGPMIGASIAGMFGVTLATTPILLAVDMARNLRAIRYRDAGRPG
jgi:hypothetical protein